MLRIESYVTPIILSYVNKYIKNLKPEDSQVSLWGGDAVFKNLDLRLDVLEQELSLPFTFINGHIHELRIHVPWTKLTSEPIIITIDTIECILKLRDADGGESEAHSQSDSLIAKTQELRKKVKQPDLEVPASYVQGLMNKILNNVRIVCNNLILKYVEDDIVLSINVKTVDHQTVDSSWNPAFIDLTPENLLLRNITTLTDLTVCLDKRNAAGKIENYQEPLLYRCSLACRMIRSFEYANSLQPSIVRCDMYCSQLHFSLSDTQLPMFMRLMQLLMALYYGELKDSDDQEALSDANNDSIISNPEGAPIPSEEDSWSSWAWSMGAAILPVYWEEELPTEYAKQQKRDRIFHFGIYAEVATWVFKLTETTSESILTGPTKTRFSPFLRIQQQGSYCSVVLKGFEAVNAQVGVSSVSIDPVGCCICGIEDTELSAVHVSVSDSPTEGAFGKFGRGSREYLTRSLFEDETVTRELWDYNYEWQSHLITVTESLLLEKTPAFASDYLYVLEIENKEDLSWDDLEAIQDDLEHSNVMERALCRVAVGPFEVNMNSGLFHRLQAIQTSLAAYEYPPYALPVTDPPAPGLETPEDQEVENLVDVTPLRKLKIIFIEPQMSLSTAQHPSIDVKSILTSRTRKKQQRASAELCMAKVLPVPYISLKLSRIECELVKPFYPLRLAAATCRMRIPSTKLMQNCYVHSSVKVVDASITIQNKDELPVHVMDKFTCKINRKKLVLPKWFAVPNTPHEKITFQTDRFSLWASMPQARLISFILSSWNQPLPVPEELHRNSLINDAINHAERFHIMLARCQSIELEYCRTEFENSVLFKVSTAFVALCHPNQDIHCLLLSGPETPAGVDLLNEKPQDEKLLHLLLQWSIGSEKQPVLSLNFAKMAALVDPLLVSWLKYSERSVVCENNLALRKIGEIRPVPKIPRKLSDGDSTHALDSSSFTFSDTRTSSYLALFVGQPRLEEPTKTDWHSKLVELNPFLSNLIIYIVVDSVTVFLPTCPLNVSSNGGMIDIIYRIYLPKKHKKTGLGDTTVINLPRIQLKNAAQKSTQLFENIDQLPFVVPPFVSTLEKLPWSLELSQCHAYSLQCSGPHVRLTLLKQCSATATLSLAPKHEEGNLTQLGIVIHVDMAPLEIVLNRRQVKSSVVLLNSYFSLITMFKSRKAPPIPTINESSVIKPTRGQHIAIDAPSRPGQKHSTEDTKKSSVKETAKKGPESRCHTETEISEKDESSSKKSKCENTTVTAWIQWTLARVSLALFSPEESATKKLRADLDELTFSVDIQNVYCKVIGKIANANILHFDKKDSSWVAGEYEGAFMSSSQHITPDLVVIEPETKKHHKCPPKPPLKPSETSKPHGFMSMTFTIAESVNAYTKWNQVVRKNFGEERFVKECVATLLYEIDVRVSTFDIIFVPVIDSFLSVFDACLGLKLTWDQAAPTTESKLPLGLSFNNKNLPLVYFQSDVIRVFLPMDVSSAKCEQNLMFMQIDSIAIAPQVDNPLTRLIIREDLYEAAVQARILGIPGSEIEDRQYQIDLNGITVSTGCWSDVAQINSTRPRSSSAELLGVRGENPALEWNNYDPNATSSVEAVFIPLLSRLNVKAILAPAIAFDDGKGNEEIVLVAGHSIEINATSDIRLFANLVQLKLIQILVEETKRFMVSLKIRTEYRRQSLLSDVADSGVDCDHSSMELRKELLVIKEERMSSEPWVFPKSFVPVEFLITGSCITLSLYQKKMASPQKMSRLHLKRKDTPSHRTKKLFDVETASTASEQSPVKLLPPPFHTRSYSNASEREDGYDGSEEESVCDSAQSATQRRLFPLVYISLVQPHAFLSCHTEKQKLDISCFNIKLKGVPSGFSVLASGQKRLPSVDDFSVPWVETKPGDPHPKTGIPPTFFTATLSDFLEGGACLNIDSGRPLRITFSENKYFQIQHVIDRIRKVFDDAESKPQDIVVKKPIDWSSYVSLLKSLRVATDQIVFGVIAAKNKNKSEVIVCLGGSEIEVESSKNLSSVSQMKVSWMIRDIQLKTMFHSLPLRPVVSPWTIKGRSKLIWNPWSSSPSCDSQFNSENLLLTIGPENIYAVEQVVDFMTRFMDFSSKTIDPIHIKPSECSRKNNEFHDDLRAGLFQYVTSTTENIPKPYQIVFDKSRGWMTWTYPEARALTKVEIYPVPFIAASDKRSSEQHCALQYYDDLLETFITYHRFQLSESKVCRLSLPGMYEKRFLAVSNIWRVCLDYKEDEFDPSPILLIVPEALAACIRVDSVFSVANLPTNQSVVTFNNFQVALTNHMHLTGNKRPAFLERYEPDTLHPNSQDFMTVSFDNTRVRFSSWTRTKNLQINGSLHACATNFRNLTQVPIFQIPRVKIDFTASEEYNQDKPSCYELQASTKSIDVYVSQTNVHSLMVSKQCWEQSQAIVENDDEFEAVKESLPMVLTQNIVVCNDTMQSFDFGQQNTDETIFVSSGNFVQYSWRSQKQPPKLRIKIRPWKCETAINVDLRQTQVLPITRTKGSCSGSLLLVRCTEAPQNIVMVTVMGVLTVANALDSELEFLIADSNQDELAKQLNSSGLVKSGSHSHSFIGHPTGIRVRTPGALTSWSNEITLDGNKDSFTLKIPTSSKGTCMLTSCRIVRQRVQNVWRLLVMFSDPFLVRSHLPGSLVLCSDSHSSKHSQKVSIKGQGKPQAVAIDTGSSHSMTFQLSPELEASKPPVSVTKSVLDQSRITSSKAPIDIDEVLSTFGDVLQTKWPYIDSPRTEYTFGDQPKTDLQIGFLLLHPACNTVIMDIRPWQLIINETDLELLFTDRGSADQIWYLSPGMVFAPPKLENLFYFGLPTGETAVFSSPLQLSKDESWYTLNLQGKLPRVGSTNISIQIANKLCYLTIQTKYEQNIHILHVSPTYFISKCTEESLQIRTLSTKLELGSSPPMNIESSILLHDKMEESPLLFWDLLEDDSDNDTVLCLQFLQEKQKSSIVSVNTTPKNSRVSFTMPVDDQVFCNEPFLLTIHLVESRVHFVIRKDLAPQMVIANNTLCPLLLAQGSLQDENLMEEELDVFMTPQSVQPQRKGYYSFPVVSSGFHRYLTEKDQKPRLHFSAQTQSGTSGDWTQGIDIDQKYDQFTVIPGLGDVKIHTETVAYTTYVFVDPASRVEVSPKDIRSRIAMASTVRLAPPTADDTEVQPVKDQSQDTPRFKVFYVTFICTELSVVLKNDTGSVIREVVRVSVDDCVVSVRPKIDRSEKLRALNYRVQDMVEIVAYAADLQIDNQLHSNRTFDFPVVLMRQKSRQRTERGFDYMVPLPPFSEALCSISCLIEKKNKCIQSVRIKANPLMIFLEDSLFYSMNDFCKGLLNDSPEKVSVNNVFLLSDVVANPLRINELFIDSISIMLSVHASKLLYIALDHSPLEFKPCHWSSVVTTGYALGNHLTTHYLFSAMFKAGWVVSSLDLLGNPGGFARTVGSGIKDFVQFPYEGILLGPWAFIAGITNGSLSLVKHLTAGTLVSVTNLASSVARNMERLSMDEEHLMRSEAGRRAQRGGLTNGLAHGLSAFGISMLGAIGGIVHQPMQAAMMEGGGPSSIVSGLGKGLLGAVVKPIGGAADLLVHTGQGLLQGAGWSDQQRVRVTPMVDSEASLQNSCLKYSWKFGKTDIWAVVEATLQTADNTYSPVTVIVDKQCVRIVDVEKDVIELEPMNLCKLICKCSSVDPTLLILEEKQPKAATLDTEDGPPPCSERVVEFVRKSCYEAMDISSDEDDSSSEDQSLRVKLLVSPHWRTFLYSVINVAIRRSKGQGFPCHLKPEFSIGFSSGFEFRP